VSIHLFKGYSLFDKDVQARLDHGPTRFPLAKFTGIDLGKFFLDKAKSLAQEHAVNAKSFLLRSPPITRGRADILSSPSQTRAPQPSSPVISTSTMRPLRGGAPSFVPSGKISTTPAAERQLLTSTPQIQHLPLMDLKVRFLLLFPF
jgi:hypothetical protein